jgi:hypothetical protein
VHLVGCTRGIGFSFLTSIGRSQNSREFLIDVTDNVYIVMNFLPFTKNAIMEWITDCLIKKRIIPQSEIITLNIHPERYLLPRSI